MNAQFAIAPSNVIAHISEVDRGLGCGCTCPVCHEPVLAKKGPEREHHFAHTSNQADCAANYETQLHQYAIRVIQETMGLIVPIDHEQGPGRWLAFDKVAEEERLDAPALRPDIIGYANGAPTSFVEMMGLPDSQLNTTYWFPWYKNVGEIDTQLRLGNVKEMTLMEAWHGEKRKAYIREHLAFNRKDLPGCGKCDFYGCPISK